MPEGQLLWEPSAEALERAHLTDYMRWLDRGLETYDDLWRWSVEDLDGFWGSLWEYFDVKASRPYERVLGKREMPSAEWFPGAELNYAEHIFRTAGADRPAIVHASELRELSEVSWAELRAQAGRIEAGLRKLGVGRGDRVVAYMPNIPETVAALLACASIGAIWSSAAPEFGAPTVIDRFKQIEPKVLLAVDGYRYGGKDFDRRDRIGELERSIPSLEQTVVLPYLGDEGDWHEVFAEDGELAFEQVPFDHPLWVLYSSGTTGLPKAIVQGQGGILLEHLKKARLHSDLSPDDRFFWFTTTGWMMWNFLVGGLLAGSTIVLYDGQPDPHKLWDFAAEAGISCFGTSAGFIGACMKAGVEPPELPALRSVGSTGSPLPAEGFDWVYEHVKRDLWLFSTSGGTDLCTAFVGACPLLPVYAGEIQARCLGAKVEAWDEDGRALTDEVGELVITEPMPSMPLFFWSDPDGERYRSSYFDMYPGVWRHGDWIKITPRGGAVIYGRSDSTINRQGVRMGTSEIYSAVEALPEILDSLVIDVRRADGEAWMPLFVVLRDGARLDDELRGQIARQVREHCSPRHVPDEVLQIEEVPRTLSGKKLEVPVKKILMGAEPDRSASRDSLANPESLDFFSELAERIVSPTS
jgi:acetoacetyl-CoA synthetase